MFHSIDEIKPPKARVGDTVYIGKHPGGDEPCTVTNVRLGKIRVSRKLYRTWYYNLDVRGVGICRPENMISFTVDTPA